MSPLFIKLHTLNFADGLRVKDTKQKIIKLGQKRTWPRPRDLLLNFGNPLLSLVRTKPLTSNFADGLRVRDTKQVILKWAKMGVE